MTEAVLGAKAQRRLNAISEGGGGMLEVLTGPNVWREVEAMARSWQSIHANLVDLLDEGRVVAGQVQTLLDDVQPLAETIGANARTFDAIIRDAQAITADATQLSRAFAAEAFQIGPSISDFRHVLADASQLTAGIKRHWLVSSFMAPQPESSFAVGATRRPNHYGE